MHTSIDRRSELSDLISTQTKLCQYLHSVEGDLQTIIDKRLALSLEVSGYEVLLQVTRQAREMVVADLTELSERQKQFIAGLWA